MIINYLCIVLPLKPWLCLPSGGKAPDDWVKCSEIYLYNQVEAYDN